MNRQTRFETALDALRNNGLYAELNTTACCRSCAADEADRPGVVSHARKGKWVGDRLSAFSDIDGRYFVEVLWFRFSDLSSARACRTAFRAQGFTVKWNGRQNKCVEIHLA